MGTRDSSAVDWIFLTVLWTGMAAFVTLHSVLILGSGSEQTHSLVRVAWFGGLGIVAATIVYFTILGDSTEAE